MPLQPKDWAVLVGIQHYGDDLGSLQGPLDDVGAFRTWIEDAATGGGALSPIPLPCRGLSSLSCAATCVATGRDSPRPVVRDSSSVISTVCAMWRATDCGVMKYLSPRAVAAFMQSRWPVAQ